MTLSEDRVFSETFADLMIRGFHSEFKRSLQLLVDEARLSQWHETILQLFYICHKNTPSSTTDFSSILSNSSSITTMSTAGAPKLESRSGLPLKLRYLAGPSLLPLRAAKANALQLRILPDSSTSHIRKTRADTTTQLIAADDRGRLVVAESTSVLFCSAIPIVNLRHVENSTATHLSRSQLSILGSDKVKFQINGVAFCPDNNRHLLVWGTSEACVAIMAKGFGSFERLIDLKLQLEPNECESEYLLKCEWMPQSELMVIAICGSVIHVFDLKRVENNSCKATTHYALAYEDVLIRSSCSLATKAMEAGNNSGVRAKLALLLDTGRMHFIDLTVDEDGILEDQGESYIECGAGASFPSAGIRRHCGGDPVAAGSTATTFGEGIILSFLRQSKLLLYQCISSCCIAMLLDDGGAICGSFELLPHIIPADVLGLGSQNSVSGPYSHFQELGIVRKDQEIFYRVTCVGRSARTNQPRLLLLEFNETSVFIKEISWPTSCTAGLGLTSSYSFVGSCTFSAPYLVGGSANDGYISSKTQVYERAFLALLTSNGSLCIFGEDCDTGVCPPFSLDNVTFATSGLRYGLNCQGLSRSMKHAPLHRKPNIYIFEELINVSEMDELVLGGDAVGKDPPNSAKKKLSLNNNDFLISPSRDGCTLTASLCNNLLPSGANEGSKQVANTALAIVAVRVLVGSMPDLLPREIVIMGSGRVIKLKKNVKRWYDFPLTDEEILLAIRNGFGK